MTHSRRPHSGSRLIIRPYYADIVLDPTSSVYHWVVQRFGSPEVIAWGQESSFELAEKTAHIYLHDRMKGEFVRVG